MDNPVYCFYSASDIWPMPRRSRSKKMLDIAAVLDAFERSGADIMCVDPGGHYACVESAAGVFRNCIRACSYDMAVLPCDTGIYIIKGTRNNTIENRPGGSK